MLLLFVVPFSCATAAPFWPQRNKQHNNQHHRKALLSSFDLNGHTYGFHPQTQTVDPLWFA